MSHPTEHLLAEFSAGSLQTGAALCIRTHLEHCDDCSRVVGDLSVLGSVMLHNSESARLSEDLFDQILDRLDSGAEDLQAAATRHGGGALASLIPGGISSIPWKAIAGGVSSYELPINDGPFSVKLLRVEKGRSVFKHTHTDSELTVLLQGGYSDELGSYTAGDFIECDGSHVHKPVAHRDQDCILLTAVSGSLKFTGPVSRLLNPFFSF